MPTPQITLDAIILPADLDWVDEYDWTGVEQVIQTTLTGALIIEESTLLAGRPITLAGGDDSAWVSRGVVELLRAKAINPQQQMTLTLADGRTFTVTWRQAARPIEARPVLRDGLPHSGTYYTLTLRLMEI